MSVNKQFSMKFLAEFHRISHFISFLISLNPSPSISTAGSSSTIFYTLDGELLGTAFTRVRRPELLRPAIGLHSPRERVSFHLGYAPPADDGPGGVLKVGDSRRH